MPVTRHFRVRHHHIRIALQCIEIMPGETFARLGSGQQRTGLFHHGVHVRFRHRPILFLQRFIDGNDELRQRLKPRKPGIAGEQLKKVVGRLDRADGLLVADAFGIDQRFVQSKQWQAELFQFDSNGIDHERNFVCFQMTSIPGEPPAMIFLGSRLASLRRAVR